MTTSRVRGAWVTARSSNAQTGLPLFDATKLVEQWWVRLTTEQRKALIDRYSLEMGHLVGVPVDARSQANRLALARRIKELKKMIREGNELLTGFPEARPRPQAACPMTSGAR